MSFVILIKTTKRSNLGFLTTFKTFFYLLARLATPVILFKNNDLRNIHTYIHTRV